MESANDIDDQLMATDCATATGSDVDDQLMATDCATATGSNDGDRMTTSAVMTMAVDLCLAFETH